MPAAVLSAAAPSVIAPSAAAPSVIAPSAAALVMLGSARPAVPADLTALTPAERDRAAAFRRPADRDSYVAAHLLVRRCAARLAGIDPAAVQLVQSCPTCDGRDHGKPAVRGRGDLHVSLSHSGGLVAAAAGWGPVGVDVEVARDRPIEESLLCRALAPAERAQVAASADPEAAFLRHWMRKEALIKLGQATLGTMARIDLSALPLDGRRQARLGRWHFLDWAGGSGEALAAVGAQPMELIIIGEGRASRPFGPTVPAPHNDRGRLPAAR